MRTKYYACLLSTLLALAASTSAEKLSGQKEIDAQELQRAGAIDVAQDLEPLATQADPLIPHDDPPIFGKSSEAQKYNELTPVSGAFQFPISLTVPTGVADLTPDLRLAYSSDNSLDSLVGAGWSLPFFSCIERRGAPVITPAVRQGRQIIPAKMTFRNASAALDSTDVYLMNGQQLVACPSGPPQYTENCPVGTYRSYFNDFAKVERFPTSVPNGWRVTQADGTAIEYGEVRTALNGEALEYCPSKVLRYGNEIRVAYKDDTPDGRIPDYIEYGGIGSAPGAWKVTFEWEQRNDYIVSVAQPGKSSLRKRLKSITISTNAGAASIQLRKFAFGYDYSPVTGRSRLTSVQEYGRDNTHALRPYLINYPANPPVGFSAAIDPDWQAPPAEAAFTLHDYWNPFEHWDANLAITPTDLNADGFMDLIRFAFTTPTSRPARAGFPYRVWLNNAGSGWSRDATWETKLAVVPEIFEKQRTSSSTNPLLPDGDDVYQGQNALDLNGDGYNDFLKVRHVSGSAYQVAVQLYDPISASYVTVDAAPWIGDPNNPWFKFTWDHPEASEFHFTDHFDPGTRIADINRDGLPDVIVSRDGYQPQSQVFINTGSGFYLSNWTVPVAFVTNFAPGVAMSDGPTKDNGVALGDVDGDGLPDLIKVLYRDIFRCDYLDPGPAAYTTETGVWLNNGHGFEFSQTWSDAAHQLTSDPVNYPDGFSINESKEYTQNCASGDLPLYLNSSYGDQIIDLNGDGRVDLVNKMTYGNGTILMQYSYMNNGHGWSPTDSRWHLPSPPPGSGAMNHGFINITDQHPDGGIRLLDYNNDGFPDILANRPDETPRLQFNAVKPSSDLVSSITNPLGGRTEVNYVQLKKSAQNPELRYPRIVVDSVTHDNGATGAAAQRGTTKYYYRQGRYKDGQFAGFGIISVEEPALGIETQVRTQWLANQDSEYCRVGQVKSETISKRICDDSGTNCVYDSNGAPNTSSAAISTLGITANLSYSSSTACPASNFGPLFTPPDTIVKTAYDPANPTLALSTKQTLAYDNFGNVQWKSDYRNASDASAYRTTFALYATKQPSEWIVNRKCMEASLDAAGKQFAESRFIYDLGQRNTCVSPSKGLLTREDHYGYDSAKVENAHTWKSYSYVPDGSGNLLTETDARGKTTTYSWNSEFPGIFKSAETNHLGQAITYHYDGYGNLQTQTDANNVTSRFVYDELQRLKEVHTNTALADSLTKSIAYSDTGVPGTHGITTFERLEDSRWLAREEYVDGFGRKLQSVRRGGSTVTSESYSFNSRGLVAKRTLPYDGSAYDPSKAGTSTNYDGFGRVVSESMPGGSSTTHQYGLLNLQGASYNYAAVSSPMGNAAQSIQKAYSLADGLNRKIWQIECNTANCTNLDALNPDIYLTQYQYNERDQITKTCLADGRGNCGSNNTSRTRYFYDGLGRLIGMKDADLSNAADGDIDSMSGPVWKFTYDENGNLKTQSDANLARGLPQGAYTEFFYDDLNRIRERTTTQDSKIYSTVFTYDTSCDAIGTDYPKGRATRKILTVTPADGQISDVCLSYDFAGRVKAKTSTLAVPGISPRTERITTDFWLSGKIKNKNLPGPEVRVYSYDALGRLAGLSAGPSTSNQTPIVQNIQYGARDQELSRQLGSTGSLTLQRQYREGDPSTLLGSRMLKKIWTTPNLNLLNLEYTEDLVGNITVIQDLAAPRTESYDFDLLNRLSARSVNGIGQESFQYDPLGNRLSVTTNTNSMLTASAAAKLGSKTLFNLASSYGGGSQETSANFTTYAKFGRGFSGGGGSHAVSCMGPVASNPCLGATDLFNYDANGNLKLRTSSGGSGTSSFAYNYDNKVTELSTPSGTTRNYYDSDGTKFGVTTGSVSSLNFDPDYTVQSGSPKYSYFTSDHLVASKSNSQLRYFLTDHLGTVRVVLDSNMGLVQRLTYNAFGAAETPPNSQIWPQRWYNSRELLAPSIYDYEARAYDANLGVFLTPDTVIPSMAVPQSLNRYAYALNNPINLKDPDGHSPRSPWPSTRNIEASGYQSPAAMGEMMIAAHVVSSALNYTGDVQLAYRAGDFDERSDTNAQSRGGQVVMVFDSNGHFVGEGNTYGFVATTNPNEQSWHVEIYSDGTMIGKKVEKVDPAMNLFSQTAKKGSIPAGVGTVGFKAIINDALGKGAAAKALTGVVGVYLFWAEGVFWNSLETSPAATLRSQLRSEAYGIHNGPKSPAATYAPVFSPMWGGMWSAHTPLQPQYP
ncbi:MAG: FG-GAP-like repeat-containing protein [Oligoflexia bacterium]|nr:FG-GAP-like repeat-containing protein [Oligoflexia bacterium]